MEDLSDIEREEQLRRWWSENWAWIIGGVALGLSMLAGWQYWQRYQVQSAERDEAGYVAVILGDDEVARGVATVKPLRENGEQRQVPLEGLAATIAAERARAPA